LGGGGGGGGGGGAGAGRRISCNSTFRNSMLIFSAVSEHEFVLISHFALRQEFFF